MSDAWVTLSIIGLALILFAWNGVPAAVVAIGASLALWALIAGFCRVWSVGVAWVSCGCGRGSLSYVVEMPSAVRGPASARPRSQRTSTVD